MKKHKKKIITATGRKNRCRICRKGNVQFEKRRVKDVLQKKQQNIQKGCNYNQSKKYFCRSGQLGKKKTNFNCEKFSPNCEILYNMRELL